MLEEWMLVEWWDVAERLRPAHANSPVLEIAGEEGRHVFRLDPAIDNRWLTRSLDLDGRFHHIAPLPLTSRTTALVPASASRQAASTRNAPFGSEELSTLTLTTS